MKVIISHDVDHLYRKDHWFRDLVYPKLAVRSLYQAFHKIITWKECRLRIASCFQKKRNYIPEIMEYNRNHSVDSAFFFGTSKGLGMSYRPEEAAEMVRNVRDHGFSVGLHGICYDDPAGMEEEYRTFVRIYGFPPCGIRMHYVRFDDRTFRNLAQLGYPFDTTEFDKTACGSQKSPYPVDGMWEFPLTIMDGYLPQKLEEAKAETLKKLRECKEKGLEYVTILFHDYQFCDAYHDKKEWYMWLIRHIEESEDDSFISYEEAVKELKKKHG